MKDSDDELLSRYMDGELSERERVELLERLEKEPGLAGRLEEFSRVDTILQESYGNIDNEPPAHVVELLNQDHGQVIPFSVRPRSPWLTAAAACLLLGVGFMAGQQRGEAPATAGPLPEESVVSRALESQPSSASGWTPVDTNFELRPVLSFLDKSGAYCREFTLVGGGIGWQGVACRDAAQWHTQVLVRLEGPAAKPGQYRPAQAQDTAIIEGFIDKRIDGIPLGTEEESERIKSHWR